MRHWLYILLFLAVLLAPFALRAVVGQGDHRSAAARPGDPRLIIVTPNNQDIRQEFAWAFERWHRDTFGQAVSVEFRVPGGAIDIKRQLEMTYRGTRDAAGNLSPGFSPDFDVVWGGGDFFFDQELKPLGVLQPLGLRQDVLDQAFPQPTLAGVRLYDAGTGNPYWAGVALSSFGIVYNPDFYDTLRLPSPKTWSDLTDPRLHGMLALADPTHSGSVAVLYMVVLQRSMADAEDQFFAANPGLSKLPKSDLAKNPAYYQALSTGWKHGMAELLLMAANARYFTASATQVPNDVGAGDAAAGVAIDFYGRVYAETVGDRRLRFVMPEGATAITPDPVAILAGVKGDRLTLAQRFVTFLLTPEAQRLWALRPGTPGGPRERALRRLPVRQDVYADQSNWSDRDNPFTQAHGFNQRAEWMGLFGDLRTLWYCAWIDARDALKDAYRDILAVKDTVRRDQLLTELANLPLEMRDVEQLRVRRRELASQGGDVDEWRARQQIDLAERFRDHYRRIGAEAQEK